MKLKNLNGWQRLGILLSAIWLVVVIAGTIVFIISATNRLKDHQENGRALVQSEWAFASIETVWNDPSTQPDPSLRFVPDPDPEVQQSAKEAVRNRYGDIDAVTFVERYQKSYPDVNFGQVNADYEDAIQALQITYRQDREGIVLGSSGVALLVWAVPLVLAYLFAWGVGWVWRGFKLKGE